MTAHILVRPTCAVCGKQSSYLELVPPHEGPRDFDVWSAQRRESFERNRNPEKWWMIFEGVEAGNGNGSSVSAERAAQLAAAFEEPLRFERVATAGFYDNAGFCKDCEVPYCRTHWHVSSTGFGRCPRGHGKSLDPHWWPED